MGNQALIAFLLFTAGNLSQNTYKYIQTFLGLYKVLTHRQYYSNNTELLFIFKAEFKLPSRISIAAIFTFSFYILYGESIVFKKNLGHHNRRKYSFWYFLHQKNVVFVYQYGESISFEAPWIWKRLVSEWCLYLKRIKQLSDF